MNGYTRITIDGQEIGLKFGYESNKWFLEAYYSKVDMYSDGETFNNIGWAKLLHCAYKNNCAIKEELPKYTVEDFYNWIEGIGTDEKRKEEFANCINIWSQTQNTAEIVEKLNSLILTEDEDEKKKNLTS